MQQVRVIKDGDGYVLTNQASVENRWMEYFEDPMNEENEGEEDGWRKVAEWSAEISKDEAVCLISSLC